MTTETSVTAKVLRFKVPIVVKKDVVGYHAFSPPLKGTLNFQKVGAMAHQLFSD